MREAVSQEDGREGTEISPQPSSGEAGPSVEPGCADAAAGAQRRALSSSKEKALECFGTNSVRRASRAISRGCQRELQDWYHQVFNEAARSNNNVWLKKKLLEAIGGSRRYSESAGGPRPRRKPRKPKAEGEVVEARGRQQGHSGGRPSAADGPLTPVASADDASDAGPQGPETPPPGPSGLPLLHFWQRWQQEQMQLGGLPPAAPASFRAAPPPAAAPATAAAAAFVGAAGIAAGAQASERLHARPCSPLDRPAKAARTLAQPSSPHSPRPAARYVLPSPPRSPLPAATQHSGEGGEACKALPGYALQPSAAASYFQPEPLPAAPLEQWLQLLPGHAARPARRPAVALPPTPAPATAPCEAGSQQAQREGADAHWMEFDSGSELLVWEQQGKGGGACPLSDVFGCDWHWC